MFDEAEQEVKKAKVKSVIPSSGHWEIVMQTPRGEERLIADGVVLTGTGAPRTVQVDHEVPTGRVFDAENFWTYSGDVLGMPEPTIAVAGDGGAAGAIIAWLLGRLGETGAGIVSVSPIGTLFPRGDGYAERRWFSDPTDWRELSLERYPV